MPGVAAVINGEPLTVRELALECIDRHGTEVLEGTINRTLLEVECKKLNITVTEKDMNDEIARAAALGVKPKADGSPDVKAWLEEVTKEPGATLENISPRCGVAIGGFAKNRRRKSRCDR